MQYEKEFLRKLYRNLLDMRLLEQKMVDTYAQGRVPGHIHSGVGQEASFVGVLANYKEGDYYKRTHRLTAVPYMMGTSLDTFFGELLAKTTGNSGGRGGAIHIGELHTGDLGFSGTLGCDAAVGVGAALTIDAEGRDNLSFVFMGDGTSSRGPVYEAMNLAAAWKLPVLFICHNNQFAISTPASYSIAVEHPGADRLPPSICPPRQWTARTYWQSTRLQRSWWRASAPVAAPPFWNVRITAGAATSRATSAPTGMPLSPRTGSPTTTA